MMTDTKPNHESITYLLIGIFLLLYTTVHLMAGLTLPFPWYDEAFYVFPSLSLIKFKAFMGPVLGQTFNEIIMMPPLHAGILAVIFAIFGFSIEVARHASGAFVLISLVFMMLTLKDYFWKYGSIVLCGLFYLNKFFIVAGNNARMENLVIMFVTMGLYFFHKNKDFKGLACLSLVPLTHPIATPFLLMACFYVAIKPFLGLQRQTIKEMSKSDKFFVLIAALIWLSILAYFLFNWDAFTKGMFGVQFARKAGRNIFGVLFHRIYFIALIFMGFVMFVLMRHNPKGILLLFFSAASWCLYKIGQEMWYDIYEAYAQLLFSVLLLHLSKTLIDQSEIFKNHLIKKVVIGIFTFFVVFWNFQMQMIANPMEYKTSVSWYGMQFRDKEPYIERSDIAIVEQFVQKLKKERGHIVIKFQLLGDTLFFHHLADDDVQISFPYIAEVGHADLKVFHFTKYNPWNKKEFDALKAESGKAKSIFPFHKSETEKWFFVVY